MRAAPPSKKGRQAQKKDPQKKDPQKKDPQKKDPQKKDPKQITRLGSVSCCLNSGLSDRATGCRGMGSRPVGLDECKIVSASMNTMQITV
jgi:hypothetical protein